MAHQHVNLLEPLAQQNPEEFAWLLKNYVSGVSSILEVGSSLGQTLFAMAAVAKRGALVRSIDLGTHLFAEGGLTYTSGNLLNKTIRDLRTLGHDADLFLGNSHSLDAVVWAKQWAPYDFVFIDGDHDYAGVKADWESYGPFGKMVGLHDVELLPDVRQLWNEIKATGRKTDWCALPQARYHNRRLGIGVVLS